MTEKIKALMRTIKSFGMWNTVRSLFTAGFFVVSSKYYAMKEDLKCEKDREKKVNHNEH